MLKMSHTKQIASSTLDFTPHHRLDENLVESMAEGKKLFKQIKNSLEKKWKEEWSGAQ